MKRVLGAGALGGGLLALTAGAAGAQEVSAEVRVCADGRGLSGLLGSCRGSGTSVTAGAGRGDGATGVRVRARAGIGVLDSGPIVSGNQVDAGIGSISPSVAGSGALPFTGAAGDLLALLASPCWSWASWSGGQPGPPPRRKEVLTGSPAEAAGRQALMVTGR